MFPGQNSQIKGMGEQAYYASDEARRIFYIGSEVFETDLSEICFGSETDKLSTPLVQPAIVASELAKYSVMKGKGFSPVLLMGHSLGEISALGAAEGISTEDVFKVTKARVEATGTKKVRSGVMAAVLGLTNEQHLEVLAHTNERLKKIGSKAMAYTANHNWRLEQVLSGHPEAIDRFQRVVKRLEGLDIVGRAGVLKLKVPGAFHSPFNEDGVEIYREAFQSVERRIPRVMLLNNKGQYMINPDLYPDYYAGQLVNGVRWDLMMHIAARDGITDFVEVPPSDDPKKAALSGLIRKEFEGHTIEVPKDYGQVVRVDWRPELSEYLSAELEAV